MFRFLLLFFYFITHPFQIFLILGHAEYQKIFWNVTIHFLKQIEFNVHLDLKKYRNSLMSYIEMELINGQKLYKNKSKTILRPCLLLQDLRFVVLLPIPSGMWRQQKILNRTTLFGCANIYIKLFFQCYSIIFYHTTYNLEQILPRRSIWSPGGVIDWLKKNVYCVGVL